MVALENLEGGALAVIDSTVCFGSSRNDTSKLDEAGFRALGWKALTELIAETGGKSRRTFDRLLKDPRAVHPDQFHRVPVPPERGGSSLMMSSQMYELLLQRYNDSKPKQGWESDYALADSLGVDRSTIGKAARRLTSKHPEWVEQKQLGSGKFANVYAPELCALLRKRYEHKNILRANNSYRNGETTGCSMPLSGASFTAPLIR